MNKSVLFIGAIVIILIALVVYFTFGTGAESTVPQVFSDNCQFHSTNDCTSVDQCTAQLAASGVPQEAIDALEIQCDGSQCMVRERC